MPPVQPQTRFLERIHFHLANEPKFVPHYDSRSGDLRDWLWPANQAGVRIHPIDMSDYRAAHEFKFPCCLCACEEHESDYTESAIYLATYGPYSRKYVAGCATNSCGYLVNVEQLYSSMDLSERRYPVRATEAPPPVIYLPTIGLRGSQNLFAAIPLRQPPPNKILDVLDHLLKLDSPVAPGLLQDEFRKLFVKCHCGKVTTRRAFKAHICVIFRNVPVVDLTVDDDIAVVGPVVIDLTGDSDEDIAMV